MTETFTKRTSSPYRFDVVGSFLRPQAIKDAREDYKAGNISADDLKVVEDKAITDLVHKQEKAGLKAVTDGEFRRSWWHYDFFWGLNGVDAKVIDDGIQFDAMPIRAEIATITGKLSGDNHPFIDHFKFTHSVASENVEVKQTIPAPAQFIHESLRSENIGATRAVYATDEALIDDVAAAYRTVIEDLYIAGARTIQFDDCSWNRIIGQSYEGFTAEQYEERKKLFVAANNKAIEGKPADLVIATHVCRGNYRSTWRVSGGYESVATPLFDQENVDAYFLEYDSDRSGGFEPLQNVTDDKKVVLGLVTSKTGDLENKDDLIARINEATKFVPLDNLFISPQCGFSSTEEGNVLTEEDQWKKIALVKEVADEVWG